jgi:hypothetical protein
MDGHRRLAHQASPGQRTPDHASAQHNGGADPASQPRTPLLLLLSELLRNVLASLALAIGFAALARRPGRDLSLLQELQNRMRRSKQGRPARRSGTTDADYLQQLSRGDRKP